MQFNTAQLIKALTETDRESLDVLHRLRQARHIKLSERDLRAPASQGRALIHLLAGGGLLGKIDPLLITEDLLGLRDQTGDTPVHAAARFQTLSTIPEAAQKPWHYSTKNLEGYAAIHLAAGTRSVVDVPPMILADPEVLTVANPDGDTTLHALAKNGNLDLLPEGALRPGDLTLKNRRGVTVAHEATGSACSMLAVSHLFDDRVLGFRDSAGVSVLDLVAAALPDYDEPLPDGLTEKALALRMSDPGLYGRVTLSFPRPESRRERIVPLRAPSCPAATVVRAVAHGGGMESVG